MHLHKYGVIQETSEVIIEVCARCHKMLCTRKDKYGRIDARTYRAEHKRDFLQRWEKEFAKEYPREKVIPNKKVDDE